MTGTGPEVRSADVGCAVAAALCALLLSPQADAGWVHDSVGIIGYSVFVPKNYSPATKYPLFMHLHAAGASASAEWPHNNEKEQDAAILASDSNQARYPCIVYAPQAPEFSLGNHWVNLPRSTPQDPNWDTGSYFVDSVPQAIPLRDALRGLDTVIARYSIDTNRIYLGGGSMGGYATYDCLCRGLGRRFACAVPVSGAGDTAKAGIFKSLPMWIFADSSDDIIPFKFQVQMVTALKKAGGSPKYTFYSNTTVEDPKYGYYSFNGHIWLMPFVIEPQLMPWIFAQRRGASGVIALADTRAGAALPATALHAARFSIAGDAAGGVCLTRAAGPAGSALFNLRGRRLTAGSADALMQPR